MDPQHPPLSSSEHEQKPLNGNDSKSTTMPLSPSPAKEREAANLSAKDVENPSSTQQPTSAESNNIKSATIPSSSPPSNDRESEVPSTKDARNLSASQQPASAESKIVQLAKHATTVTDQLVLSPDVDTVGSPNPKYECAQCGTIGHRATDCNAYLVNGHIGTHCCVFCNVKDHPSRLCPKLWQGLINARTVFRMLVILRGGKPPVLVPFWFWQINFSKLTALMLNSGQLFPPQTPGFATARYVRERAWQPTTTRILDLTLYVAALDWDEDQWCRAFAPHYTIPWDCIGCTLPAKSSSGDNVSVDI